jgi:3'(2'), 5'-bisphosphate nucleotidase
LKIDVYLHIRQETMKLDMTPPEVKFAVHAVRQASSLVKHIQAEMVTPALTKEDRSPVTIADYASQALVGSLMAKHFPAEVLVGEEDAGAFSTHEGRATLELVTGFVHQMVPEASPEAVSDWIQRGAGSTGRRFWTLDPIDGTKGFLRGDQYAVAFALVVDGQVQIGVLGCPNLTGGWQPDFNGSGSLLLAVRGEGAWVLPLAGDDAPDRMQVSPHSDPKKARMLRSFESGHTNVSQIDEFASVLGVEAAPVSMDSQAKYAVLAAGQGDLMLRLLSPRAPDYKEKIWDQAAGSLVVEEAGGLVTDLHGRSLDFSIGRMLVKNRGILASNRWLHPAALDALKRIRA